MIDLVVIVTTELNIIIITMTELVVIVITGLNMIIVSINIFKIQNVIRWCLIEMIWIVINVNISFLFFIDHFL